MAVDREVPRVPRAGPATAVVEREIGIGTSGGPESCDYCSSMRLEWRKCKLICLDCCQINKSCADL
jgi:hypothetical protein